MTAWTPPPKKKQKKKQMAAVSWDWDVWDEIVKNQFRCHIKLLWDNTNLVILG